MSFTTTWTKKEIFLNIYIYCKTIKNTQTDSIYIYINTNKHRNRWKQSIDIIDGKNIFLPIQCSKVIKIRKSSINSK